MIQLIFLETTSILIPLGKISHLDLPGNDINPDHAIENQPSGENDLIDLFGNDIEPDTAEKNQSSETIPSDTSDVNGSIALSGNDVDPDHNLKNSSRHATDYVDKPGKKQSKGKNPKTTSKVTSNDDISYNGLPEINHSDNPTGNESNTEKKGWKVLLEMTTMHLLMSRMKMITLKKRIHCLLNRKSSFRK